MNSGRMTFRFDEETDGQRTGAADRRMFRGQATALKANDRNPREEIAQAPHHREAEPILELERVELPWSAEVSYMPSSPPRGRDWQETADEREDEPGWYGQFDTIGNSYAGSGYPSQENNSYTGPYHTRRPSHWWKFALSVAGALGTGILLGYAALSFFGSGTADTGNGSADTAARPGTVQSGNAAGEGIAAADITGVPADGTGEAAEAELAVQIAPQSYYLLQYGVFSTPAGAAQAQQELVAAGLAAGLDPADGNRVYAGMSPDREQAKLLSSGLKNQGIELYVREVALPAVNRVRYSGTADAVNSYFAASSKLLSALSGLSASKLSGAGSGSSTAVSDLHMQWTQALGLLTPGLSPEGQAIASQLENSMSRGIAALDEYGKNQAEGLLWEVQEAMMGFLTGQRSLLSAMG